MFRLALRNSFHIRVSTVMLLLTLLTTPIHAETNLDLTISDNRQANARVNKKVEIDVNDEEATVEIGAGGNIRPESNYRTELEENFTWHFHSQWENKYISEGRNNLSKAGIVSFSSEVEFSGFSIVPWYAEATSLDYKELNLNAIYGATLGNNLEVYVGLSYLQAKESTQSSSDQEVSFDLSYKIKEKLFILAGLYHSIEAGGAFSEIFVKQSYRYNKKIRMAFLAGVGANMGYVTAGHKGLNHIQLRIEASYLLGKQIEAYSYLASTKAIDKDVNSYIDDALLVDATWAALGITYRF